MSDAVAPGSRSSNPLPGLPDDLSEAALAAAPILRSLDDLLIHDLDDEETADAFYAIVDP